MIKITKNVFFSAKKEQCNLVTRFFCDLCQYKDGVSRGWMVMMVTKRPAWCESDQAHARVKVLKKSQTLFGDNVTTLSFSYHGVLSW